MMTLALRMGRTLDELGRAMTAAEFQLWEAFNALDPFTSDRDDLRAATVAHAAAASNGADCKPSDFCPDFWEDAPSEQTEDDIKRRAIAMTKLLGGTVTR